MKKCEKVILKYLHMTYIINKLVYNLAKIYEVSSQLDQKHLIWDWIGLKGNTRYSRSQACIRNSYWLQPPRLRQDVIFYMFHS